MLKSICRANPGWYELDNESGESDADCVYSRLSQSGYNGVCLASVDEAGWDSLKIPRNLALRGNTIESKAPPGGLKLTRITQHCKCGISTKLDPNVFAMEDKDAFNLPYVFGGAGEFETKSGERDTDLCKPNEYNR